MPNLSTANARMALAGVTAAAAAVFMGGTIARATSDPQESPKVLAAPAPQSPAAAELFGDLAKAPKDLQTGSALRAKMLHDGLIDASFGLQDADFDAAVKTDLGNGAAAFLVPAGDNTCVLIQTPANGIGGSCASSALTAKGVPHVVTQSEAGTTAEIAVAVPSSQGAPRIVRRDGSKRALPVKGNFAAAVVNIDDKVELADGTVVNDLAGIRAADRK